MDRFVIALILIIGGITGLVLYQIFTSESELQNKSGFNQTAMLERGNVAMGFNQSMIHNNFKAITNGGKIMIMSTNMSDTKTINEIRSHVTDIQHEFSQGNFTKPFYI